MQPATPNVKMARPPLACTVCMKRFPKDERVAKILLTKDFATKGVVYPAGSYILTCMRCIGP